MSKIMGTADQIEAQLDIKTREMEQHQQNGNYVEAENCRLAVEQLKRDYEARRLYEIEQKHRQESSELAKTHEQELQHFNRFWDKKMDELKIDGDKALADLKQRHEDELKKTRDELEQQLSLKLKESSELLNLRRMEEHMAKQKNYVEAQKVKDKCAVLEKQEKEVWLNTRNSKIETSLNTLRSKQEGEMTALLKKIKTGTDEQIKDRGIEDNRLRQKYSNVCKELKMQQEKEILSHKGQFKSKGGSSTNSPTKTQSKTGGFR